MGFKTSSFVTYKGILLTVFLALLSPVKPFIIGKLVGDYVRLGDEKVY